MSDDPYSDEELFDEPEPDDSEAGLQSLIASHVELAIGQHNAARAVLEDHPDADLEQLGREVEARAQALGREDLAQDLRFWKDTVERPDPPQPEAPQTAEQLFDEQVIGSQHAGSRVLDFGAE